MQKVLARWRLHGDKNQTIIYSTNTLRVLDLRQLALVSGRHTRRQPIRQAGRQIDRQRGMQAGRQTDRPTARINLHTYLSSAGVGDTDAVVAEISVYGSPTLDQGLEQVAKTFILIPCAEILYI